MSNYIKSTIELPEEYTPVWVCICGRRPMKMYRVGNIFEFYNKEFHKNGNYCSIGEGVIWRYA